MGKSNQENEYEEAVKAIAEEFRKNKQPNTAAYVEMFGLNLSPWFYHLTPVSEKEAFYKRCVEEGHPWDWYQSDVPEDATL